MTLRRLVVAPLGVLLVAPSAQAAQQQNAAIDFSWYQPIAMTSIQQVIHVQQRATATYWALSSETNDNANGMYMGLQTNGSRWDGTVGDMAIFSLWNANGSRGTCGTFSGEGTGLSCRLAYTVRTDRQYRYRLARQEADGNNWWWGAWVKDLTSGTETYIGGLRAPAGTGWLGNPVNFVEYFGNAVPTIAQVPRSISDWGVPTVNSTTSRPVVSYLSRGTGANSTVQPAVDSTEPFLRVTLGGPLP